MFSEPPSWLRKGDEAHNLETVQFAVDPGLEDLTVHAHVLATGHVKELDVVREQVVREGLQLWAFAVWQWFETCHVVTRDGDGGMARSW